MSEYNQYLSRPLDLPKSGNSTMPGHVALEKEIEPPVPVQAKVKMPDSEEEPIYNPNFSYDGYQVVRGEYFAHIQEPSISFADCKIIFNKACIRKLPNAEYVQILVSRKDRNLVIRPSTEDMKDSFPWMSPGGNPRSITCRIFYAMLVDMMAWNPNNRYKLIGKLNRSNTELLLVFNLDSTEIYQREMKIAEDGEEKWRSSRKPVFPDDWKNQFGLPVEENQKVFQINIFDGYAVFGLKNKESEQHINQQDPNSTLSAGGEQDGV